LCSFLTSFSLQFTLGFLLIIIILIIVGLFVQANYDRDGTPENFQKWVETILDVGNRMSLFRIDCH
jgi:F0F1-type ATP synthase membrane subunit a